jgi:transcriptional regulator with XRE-family HTH domain
MIDRWQMSDAHISAAQLRAARAWLEISQDELAAKAGVGRRAIADFERGARMPYDRTLQQLRIALEALGVQFVFEGMLAVGVVVKRTETPSGAE